VRSLFDADFWCGEGLEMLERSSNGLGMRKSIDLSLTLSAWLCAEREFMCFV
jgi:hypothetical protein